MTFVVRGECCLRSITRFDIQLSCRFRLDVVQRAIIRLGIVFDLSYCAV